MFDNDMKPLQKPPAFRDSGLPPPPQLRKPDHPPPYFHPQKPSHGGGRSCCSRICLCLLISTLFITLFLVSFGGFLFLLYEPNLPTVQLKSLSVEKLGVSSALELDSKADVRIGFNNPNKKIKFVYEKIFVFLKGGGLKGEFEIGEGWVPGFGQGPKNTTVTKAVVKGREKMKSEKEAKKVREQFRAKSLVMSLEARSGIRVDIGGIKSGRIQVKVVCGGWTLKAVQNGATPNCKVFFSF